MKQTSLRSIPSLILNSLAQLQDGLNTMINQSWRNVRTLDDWALAITMETAELIDSYPWKWWKNLSLEPDINNVRIEMVDIFHFSLSGMMMMQHLDKNKLSNATRQKLEESFASFEPHNTEHTTVLNGMVFLPLNQTQNAIATFRNLIQLANAYRFDTITEAIIYGAHDLNFNLVAYYVAKHTLNYIRQLNGYKNGTYTKVINNIEDNFILHKCIEDVSFDRTLDTKQYETVWNDIMGRVYDSFQVSLQDRKNVQYWISLPDREIST